MPPRHDELWWLFRLFAISDSKSATLVDKSARSIVNDKSWIGGYRKCPHACVVCVPPERTVCCVCVPWPRINRWDSGNPEPWACSCGPGQLRECPLVCAVGNSPDCRDGGRPPTLCKWFTKYGKWLSGSISDVNLRIDGFRRYFLMVTGSLGKEPVAVLLDISWI